MKEHDFNEVVQLIVKEDPRFDRSAYVFLRKALDHTIDKERKQKSNAVPRQRHVTGQELLVGVKEFALEQYGPLAFTVLADWGVNKCEDFGDMVFNLIDYGVFSKNEQDAKEDFVSIFTFHDAFLKPFQPKSRRLKRPRYKALESL